MTHWNTPIFATSTRILSLSLLILLNACAGTATRSNNADLAEIDQQRSRAEQVFLYQSRVADALLDEYPLLDSFAEADPELVAAEARMNETCSPLTRAVLAQLEGQQPSLGLRFQVFTTLGACERAAQRIENLIRNPAPQGDREAI